eukprot:gb/GFBE01074965.1/.p1 GENE.gb/GFBE01074965.1/~~gb/GFBE01074965.1/.p1  ORF type:complete len:680 (+),score=244.25 gb/GFBE01074965.1/:1-2040(+)
MRATMFRICLVFAAVAAAAAVGGPAAAQEHLHAVEEKNLRKVDVSETSLSMAISESFMKRWEASSTLRVQLWVLGALCSVGLVASLVFFWNSTPANEKIVSDEAACAEEEPLLEKKVEEDVPAPAVEKAAPTAAVVEDDAPADVALDVEKDAAELGPSLEDYEDLVRKLLQKGAQSLGPKVAKGAQVASIVTDKVSSLADKAKALVVAELTDTAGSVARALELEELMLLFDSDAAVSSNFPPLSILLAGLLVPVNLTISMVCHVAQVVLVLIPVLCVAGYAEYADWDSPCTSIPGLRLWARVVGTLAGLITISRLAQVAKCAAAKAEIQRKSEEMKGKLAEAESAASSGMSGLEDLKQLFVFHATTLQQAVVCESRTRVNVFSHIVGFGTLLWLLTTFWNLYLYFAYMFVPGVVAFAEAAKDDPSYCAAWVTVCTAKLSIILALLFFFANVMTVFFWVSETSLNMNSVADKIVASAKAFDNLSLGLPVAQLLVKAFLLRGATDVLCARFAVQVSEKDALAKSLLDTETRLAALKAQLDAKEGEMDGLKEEMITCGGSLGAQAERMSAPAKSGIEAMQEKSAEMMEEARRQAAELEKQTGEEIEKIMEKIREMIEQAKAAAKEAAAQAAEAAEQAKQQAMEVAEQAKEQAMEAAEQAKEAAVDAQAQLKEQAAAAQAMVK